LPPARMAAMILWLEKYFGTASYNSMVFE